MKCGHGRADRDVLALAAGLWVVTLFRGILGYATMTPTCPEREKEALKQMLPINLVLPHVNQRRQSPHGREHSADGGGEAATVPAPCKGIRYSAAPDLQEPYKVLRESLLSPHLEMWPPNSESAYAVEQVTPDVKLLTYPPPHPPGPCQKAHTAETGFHMTQLEQWGSPGREGWEMCVLWISLCTMTWPNVNVLSAAWSDTHPVRDHRLWGFPCTLHTVW